LFVPVGVAAAQVGGDFDGDGFDDLAIGVPFEDIDGQTDAGVVHILYGATKYLRANQDQIWHLNSQGMNGEAMFGDTFGMALAVGDFNGDGFDDLAVGAPGADVAGQSDAGTVHVIYGSNTGLRSNKDQRWHQNSDGIEDDAEVFDAFGTTLVAGDFDNDGRDDLAIGVPFEDVDGMDDAGRVHILYGSNNGLRSNGSQLLEQGFNSGIEGQMDASDMFGHALAVGDFDNDGRDDLAIGVPNDIVDGSSQAGGVNILYGTSSGLTTTDNQLWTQNTNDILDEAEPGDFMGFSLAVGDFDDDNRDDLAIGVPGEDLDAGANAGAVHVLYGRGGGLRSNDNQFFHQDVENMNDKVEFDDQFGYALGAGDFDEDDRDDLIIGIPFEDISGFSDAGAIAVMYGTSSGISVSGDRFFHQNSAGFRESIKEGDKFGAAIAVSDFNGDGNMDAAIAVPGEDVDAVPDAGAVHVLYGSAVKKLNAGRDQIWSQNSGGVADSAEIDDVMGVSLGR
jgi:hypothetical protein